MLKHECKACPRLTGCLTLALVLWAFAAPSSFAEPPNPFGGTGGATDKKDFEEENDVLSDPVDNFGFDPPENLAPPPLPNGATGGTFGGVGAPPPAPPPVQAPPPTAANRANNRPTGNRAVPGARTAYETAVSLEPAFLPAADSLKKLP